MKKIIAVGAATTAALAGLLSASSPAYAAAPSPSSSCSAQLSQGATTPHGASEWAPGLLGEFVSESARSAPGAVGAQSKVFARQHGDLDACIPF